MSVSAKPKSDLTVLPARNAGLRKVALAACLTGVPEHVIAADGRLSVTVVHRWIAARYSPGHPGDN